MASEVASAYVSLTANTGGLTTGLTAAEAKVRGFASSADRTASRASKSFSAMGVAMKRGLMVGGIAAGVALGSAVKTAADFETEMSALRSVTKAGAKDMDRLKESALDLGAATKFSALEVAGAQTELARAGMSTSQILGGSLKGSLALAAAGQMELADASATIVDTMGQFGLKVGDATHIADALAEAANATTADVSEMAQGLENVGNIAKNAGLSFDQTVVAMELLAQNGTKGAEAGSAFRSMLTNIATPSEKAAKKMRELGLEFYDANGNFKEMDAVAGMLQKSFAGLTAEEKQNAAAVVAGTYGQKAMLAIMAGGPKVAREFEQGLRRQGQSARMAAVMNDNLQGKLEQLGGAVETIKIRVGSALIPILSDAAVATAAWLDELGDSKGLESFADGLADGFEDFASAAGKAWDVAGPLLSQLGDIGEEAFSALVSAAQGAGPVLMTAASAAGAVASAALSVIGPVTSAAAALAGIPGVSGSATAALLGVAAAFGAFKAINIGTGAVAGLAAFVASLRSVPAATAVAVASTRTLAAQSAQASTATARANMIAAASQASYVKAFVGGNTTAARSAVTAAQTQLSAQTRVAAISATSARTFSRTFATSSAAVANTATKTGGVMAALGRTFPGVAASLGAVATPAGLAAIAIGGVAAGVGLLASGAFAGTNSAQRLADALNAVRTASDAAKGALSGFSGAVDQMKDFDIQVTAAKARLISAQERLNAVMADANSTAGQRAQAQAELVAAERQLAVTQRDRAKAQREVSAQAVRSVVDLARLSTEITRGKGVTDEQAAAMQHLGQRLGISDEATAKMVAQQRKLANQGATTGERMDALRGSIAAAARDMDTSTKSGKRAHDVLAKLSQLDGAGLVRVAGRIQDLERTGVRSGLAIDTALDEALRDRTVRLTARDRATSVAGSVKRAIDAVRDKTVSIVATTNAREVAAEAQAAVNSVQDSVVHITTIFQGRHPKGSPRVYEMLGMLDKTPKSRTVDVTFRPHGTGLTTEMARRASQPPSGDPKALKRFYGGSTNPLREAISNAGSLLIRADLDIANLPDVISEANRAGVSLGGAFAKEIAKGRSELARAVAQSNELIKRVEAVRTLTGQLSSAKSAVRTATGDEKGKARADLARVQGQLDKAQASFRALAGDDTAARALDKLQQKIARSIGKMRPQAGLLAEAAAEFASAKEKLVDSVTTQALEQFDQDTQRRLDGIRGTFEDGFRQIGGTFELVPGIMSQVEARLSASTKSVTDALQAETDGIAETYRVRGKALDREMAAEMKVFDKQAQAREKAIDDATKALTASEAKLAAIRGQQNDANLNRGVMDSEAALREAITKRMPTGEVQARMRAVEDARNAVMVDGLEKRAEVERAEADARGEAQKEALAAQVERERFALEDAQELRRMALDAQQTAETTAAQARAEAQTTTLSNSAAAERIYWQQQQDGQTAALESQRNVERASLERSLENWGGNFMRLRGMFTGNHNTMLGQVQAFSDRISVSGETVGANYAAGIRDSFPTVRRAAGDLAGIVSQYLQLHSPAEKGPLSSLDTWWKPLGDTLIGGSNFNAINRALTQLADPANGGSSYPGRTVVIHNEVTVVDRTTTGMSRDQARRLASDLKPEMDRIVGIR